MKSMTDLYNYLIIFLYYQLIFQFVHTNRSLHVLAARKKFLCKVPRSHLECWNHWNLICSKRKFCVLKT